MVIDHSVEDLNLGLTKKQQHPVDLPPRHKVFLNIDLKQCGLGGDDMEISTYLLQFLIAFLFITICLSGYCRIE
ncbi:hypothetical protein [Chryseobacterium luteum]|uniref:Uncharacterized protein n=1 Tax=Chryseobacterium luteum TaxID=421531 RepID=A0A085ZEH0_9FLAO|nr:hypothetical protein [Chryseobacterium luteum]KFF02834.1 hypothetical protein IX38_12790 [Chryseobacterium luteum]